MLERIAGVRDVGSVREIAEVSRKGSEGERGRVEGAGTGARGL